MLNILSIQFKGQGYEVVTAVDGSEALRKLSIPPLPDCFLLDLMMPKMNKALLKLFSSNGLSDPDLPDKIRALGKQFPAYQKELNLSAFTLENARRKR